MQALVILWDLWVNNKPHFLLLRLDTSLVSNAAVLNHKVLQPAP